MHQTTNCNASQQNMHLNCERGLKCDGGEYSNGKSLFVSLSSHIISCSTIPPLSTFHYKGVFVSLQTIKRPCIFQHMENCLVLRM